MSNRVRLSASILFIMFCLASLTIATMSIWNMISSEEAMDAFTKVIYTCCAILVVSLVVMLVVKMTESKK